MSFHLDDESIPKKDIVIVAAAGTHQIWAVFVDDVIWWKFKKYTAGTVVVIAGTGAEENRNNSYPSNAAFAQPSGLAVKCTQLSTGSATGSDEMFIADSESSCIRKLSLVDGKVLAVAGGDRNPRVSKSNLVFIVVSSALNYDLPFQNLFAFGDVDGKGVIAKLQHPLGVCFSPKDNFVYVADTYNHKIKRIDATTNHCETCNIVDDSKNAMVFSEPGGLCLNPTGEILYVANTNNHSIELVDLNAMITKPLKLSFNTYSVPQQNIDDKSLKLATVKISPRGGALRFAVTLNLSSGICFTTGAPQKWVTELPDKRWTIKNGNGSSFEQQPLHLELCVSSGNSFDSDKILVSFQLNLCATDVCFSKRFALEIPVTFSDDGLESINEEVIINVSRDSVDL